LRLSFVILFASLLLLPIHPQGAAAQSETLVFLVRHAERADDDEGNRMAMDPRMTDDPPLSAEGQDRAALLAEMLSDAGITRIHSTDYRRTRETAQPTADGAGIEISLYDASDLEGFAKELISTPGRHLVVGHSNTTPGLVEALGGEAGPPIESLEYDRLYLVTFSNDGARTVLLRFGTGFLY
jgi:phosphohistidine phosphatase SixA